MITLAMIWLAESHAPPRHEIKTAATKTATTVHKDFQSLLKNIRTIPEPLLDKNTEYQALLVRRLPGVPEPANGPMAILAGMEKVHMYYLDQFDMSAVNIPATWDADWLLEIIQQDPSVMHAYKEPEEEETMSAGVRPNDPWFRYQTNLHDPDHDVDIDAPEAWAYTTGSDSVVVVVHEFAGINLNDPDLRPNLWVNEVEQAGMPGVDDDNNGCVDDIHGCEPYNNPPNGDVHDTRDRIGHGTRVSRVLAARGNDRHEMTGVAWNVRIMTIPSSPGVRAVNYILKMRRDYGVNIRVMNYSGGAADCNPLSIEGEPFHIDQHRGYQALNDEGIMIVQAAGNDGINFSSTHYATRQIDIGCHDLDNIIVASGQSANSRTRWDEGDNISSSNYGHEACDLFAPAENIIEGSGPNPWQTASGTSYSTPQVSAAIALLWSFRPDLSVTEVRSALLDTVDRFPAFEGLVASGGALNIANALYSVATPGIRIHSSQTTITATNNGYLDLSLTREPVRPSSGEVVVLEGAAMTPPDTNATVTSSTLTFTSANWHIPQRMSVQATGTDDSELLLQISVNTARSTTDYRSLPMRTATFTLQNENRATNTEPEPMPILCQKLRTTMANAPNP